MAKRRKVRESRPETDPHYGVPARFIERLRAILPPDRSEPLLERFVLPPCHCAARINPLRAARQESLRELEQAGLTPSPLPWYPDGFTLPIAQRRALVDSPAVADGRIYIQNPSSMLAALMLAPEPGEQVLDLAAAPGGKTLILAAMMERSGWLSAVEPVRDRFFRLQRTLKRYGADHVHTYLRDGIGVERAVGERFDRVLLDAPCSSESRFHRDDPASFAYWGEKKIKAVSRKQRRLIESAFASLRPGGRLLYSTCSYAPEENEAVVNHLLERSGGSATLLPLDLPPALPPRSWQAGLTQWQQRHYAPTLNLTRRILPDDTLDGFYLALIGRQ